jgi:hypothetical protein
MIWLTPNRPRVVSLTVVRDVEARSETDSIFVMQFGQVIDHGMKY